MNMRVQHLITISAAALIAVFSVSCSKSSTNQTSESNGPAEVSTNVTDLGVVELSPNVANRLSLGPNKDCVATPVVNPSGKLEIQISIEAKKPTGGTQVLGSAIAITPPGQSFTLQVGNMTIGMTPKLKSQ